MKKQIKSNMYQDSKKQWNVFIGCKFDCLYCKKSYQLQMKRQKNRCMKCYNYEPHFHEERLHQSLPLTYNDEFIWCCSSGDIFFAEYNWIEKIINRIKKMPNRTFFFQTKDPICFFKYKFPENVILGITLETNRYYKISKAPEPFKRFRYFSNLKHPRKFITIEPIMDFDLDKLITWVKYCFPERIYIGYDTKKTKLPEPSLEKTMLLIDKLSKFTKVKTKLLREKWDGNG